MDSSIKKHSIPFESVSDLNLLFDAIGDAKYVLLGESSHGTSEFYTVRAELTKKLIKEKGFSFIAVEGDWPACQSINRYIKGYDQEKKTSKKCLKPLIDGLIGCGLIGKSLIWLNG